MTKQEIKEKVMNTELTALKTTTAVAKHYKILGHAMRYGTHLIATNRIWNDALGAYEHFAAIFEILGEGKNAPVALATEADEAFTDEGHATAWAIGMINAL
ncbi:hypothetical protein HMPREF0576_0848 [Mobiluncus holmesii ATCC 35242]|uniref:Nucleotide modification associated domain-containing protein n=2 Tax=Mobiluncus holmesii TaxID=144178 RepID=E6M3E3_9ACTO|nr:hypothetical protein HMPREF0576_0848 [Mobiluncus holmesii ATCC 35242]